MTEPTRTTDDQTFLDAIEGYTGRLSYQRGDRVELHVSTTESLFDICVERWGATRETVLEISNCAGTYYPPPKNASATGCGWPVAHTFEIDEAWTSGFYLVTLSVAGVPTDRATAHACFVVRNAATSQRRDQDGMLYVLPTNTWNAYNTWGGKSLYTGATQVSFARPFARGMLCRPDVERDDRKSRPTRFGETADADGTIFQEYRTTNGYPSAIGSTGWFTHGRRFVEWAEHEGHSFDYAISSDLEDPTVLDGYAGVVLVGHDEYWSWGQRENVERFVKDGGTLASFSGNTMFWQVRIEDSPMGRTMVCYKYRAHREDPITDNADPTRMSGMWADPVVGLPEWTLLGAGSAFGLYHRFGQATAQGVGGFVVYRHEHWLFDGTALGYGDVLGRDEGVVGYETVGCPIALDRLQLPVPSTDAIERGVPVDTEIVAWVPASNLAVGEYPLSIAALSDQGDLEFVAERVFRDDPDASERARYGNAVMLTTRPFGDEGGEVITIGTTDWVFGLPTNAAVAQVTANVLRRAAASAVG